MRPIREVPYRSLRQGAIGSTSPEAPLRSLTLILSLIACAPKSAPEDRAFEQAKAVVAAFERGEAKPIKLDEATESEALAHAYMGEYLWEIYASTIAARAAVDPVIGEDPRWSGHPLAFPAPETETCCFRVAFPSGSGDALIPWITAKAGWGLEEVTHNAGPELPAVGDADPLFSQIAGLLQQADAKIDGDFEPAIYVAMTDLTKDPNDDDVWVYYIPTVADNEVGVGGIEAVVWEDRQGQPTTLTLGGQARTWPADTLTTGPGLFLTATGNTPNEAHIFASRRYDLPLWIELDTGLWRVEGNAVGLYATKH